MLQDSIQKNRFAEMSLAPGKLGFTKTAMEELATAIIRLRKQKQLTKSRLSHFSGVSEDAITDIESGETKVFDTEVLKNLSKALDADQNYLLFLAGHVDSSVPGSRELVKVTKAEEEHELLSHRDFIHSDHTHGSL